MSLSEINSPFISNFLRDISPGAQRDDFPGRGASTGGSGFASTPFPRGGGGVPTPCGFPVLLMKGYNLKFC